MTEDSQTEQNPRSRIRRGGPALIAAGLLAIGGAVGAVAMQHSGPTIEMAPASPVAISSLSSSPGIVTLRGRVAEIYGSRFILANSSGRMLVDTGPGGEESDLVTRNAPVTVQGRFERGFVHATFLVGADGKVTALRPAGPGRHGRHGPPPPPPADAPPPAAATAAAPAAGATAPAPR